VPRRSAECWASAICSRGSVRKAGEQVRINVHLIHSTTGFQVWADDFTGEMKDVFSLQETN